MTSLAGRFRGVETVLDFDSKDLHLGLQYHNSTFAVKSIKEIIGIPGAYYYSELFIAHHFWSYLITFMHRRLNMHLFSKRIHQNNREILHLCSGVFDRNISMFSICSVFIFIL